MTTRSATPDDRSDAPQSAMPTQPSMAAAQLRRRPIVWSISGNDSGGGAGLSADARVAEAFGVHLCPVVACLTAQNSLAVEHVTPISATQLDAQLEALADDLPPEAIKTGLLGDAALVKVVARWVDRLRRKQPQLPLVVDPVLHAGTGSGAAYANAALLAAYQELLLPRASVITPDRREAQALLDEGESAELPTQPDAVVPRGGSQRAPTPPRTPAPARAAVPALARALRSAGARAVCITVGDSAEPDTSGLAGLALDWLDSDLAQGWLALPRLPTAHNRGTGCTHSTAIAAAMARGFVAADAAVLAKMATAAALQQGYAAGAGAGPVGVAAGFLAEASLLPRMSWGEDVASLAGGAATSATLAARPLQPGVYALVEHAARIPAILAAAGDDLCALQLRVKRDAHETLDDARFDALVQAQIAEAAAHLAGRGIALYVNDHWRAAAEARDAWCLAQVNHPAPASDSGAVFGKPADSAHAVPLGVHLGQEDLEALGAVGRAELRLALAGATVGPAPCAAASSPSPIALGISSHSLWELARAASLAPTYIACGPVWPTLTKAMPWRAQGIDNLRWWSAMAPAPVVAIGGVLEPAQAEACAAAGAAAVCLVRALQGDALADWPTWRAAWQRGQAAAASASTGGWPHPSLDAPNRA